MCLFQGFYEEKSHAGKCRTFFPLLLSLNLSSSILLCIYIHTYTHRCVWLCVYYDGTKKMSLLEAQSVCARLFCVVLYNKAVACTSHFIYLFAFAKIGNRNHREQIVRCRYREANVGIEKLEFLKPRMENHKQKFNSKRKLKGTERWRWQKQRRRRQKSTNERYKWLYTIANPPY